VHIAKKPDITQREIAQILGVSISGMNYCLNALIDKGWVKVINFNESKNKLGYVYLLTPSGISEKTSLMKSFLQRKFKEYEEMRSEIVSLLSEVSQSLKIIENNIMMLGDEFRNAQDKSDTWVCGLKTIKQ
jgi:EPS-associated MarR family transcriptional regulator